MDSDGFVWICMELYGILGISMNFWTFLYGY